MNRGNSVEIERKYRIDRFPDDREGWPLLKAAEVQQGYLATSPTVRIRSEEATYPETKTTYILCFKGEGTLVRQEIELPLDQETFLQLQSLLPASMIRKDYRVYALPDGHRLECSLVDGDQPDGFYYAEVEFQSVEESEAFVPPDFLGSEATEDPDFSMSEYWLRKKKACPGPDMGNPP